MPVPGPTPVLDLNASESASYPGSGGTWFDLSVNNYDFTMYNPAFTAATASTPAYFSFPARNFGDALTVYGEYNGTPAITNQSAWTGYFWVRRAGNHGSYTQNRLSIFANGREDLVGGDNGWSYGTYNNPNAANDNVVIEAAGVGVKDSGYPMGNDCWVNIAYIYSGGTISFYENGVAIGSQSFSYTLPADGMWISRTAGSYFSWIGDITIARQYHVALTGPQLLAAIAYDQSTYNLGTPTVIASWDASNLASYSGSGNTWFDLTSNNIDLTNASAWSYTAKNTTPNPLGWTNPGYFENTTTNRMISTLSNYLRFSTTGTIQGWFYNNNTFGVPLAFPFPGNFPSYWFQAYANKPGFNFLVDSTFRNWDPGGSIINLQWFNWAVVFNNGNADLYINGVYVSTNSQSAFGNGINYSAGQLQLVLGDIDNTGTNFPFVGRIGEIKIYDTALTAGQILSNYNDTLYKYDGNVAPPITATFDLNANETASASGSGATWYDLSGNNYNFQMTNPTFVAPTPSDAGYFQFPITNTVHPPASYGSYTSGVAVTDTSWTIYAWIKYSGSGSTTNLSRYPIFWNGVDPSVSTDGWNFQLTGPSQAPAGRMQLEGKTVSSTTNSTVVTPDQWVQVAATLNGSSGTFYIDGQSVGTFSGFTFNTPTSAMFIEKTYNDSFPGNISIVRLYDTALSGTAISNLYDNDLATYFTFTPPGPTYSGLVGGRTFGMGFAG